MDVLRRYGLHCLKETLLNSYIANDFHILLAEITEICLKLERDAVKFVAHA